ncbi:MAG TPA: hypothetical protein VF464_04970 [Candidatus Methylomirabilis sp.]
MAAIVSPYALTPASAIISSCTGMPADSASIGSFMVKPIRASTCPTSSGCTPKPMSASWSCSGLMLLASRNRVSPCEVALPFLEPIFFPSISCAVLMGLAWGLIRQMGVCW